MIVIKCRNVNQALEKGITEIQDKGVKVDSRAGETLEIQEPVTTVYSKPWERVLLSQIRDANPFFHLMESLWILAGRKDVKFLTEFNKRMAEYSDNGETFNAPYGYRARNQVCGLYQDQLSAVVELLKRDPNSRQAVVQIWDPIDLCNTSTKDKACNMQIVFKIRSGALDMTVYNRSNDMIWGAYGANAVQFSMIQEYVAAHLNVPMGYYTQVSNSFHVYTTGPGGKKWDEVRTHYKNENLYNRSGYKLVLMTNSEIELIEKDLELLFQLYDKGGISNCFQSLYDSEYFLDLVIPMLLTHYYYKSGDYGSAEKHCKSILSFDWRIACQQWLSNRGVFI